MMRKPRYGELNAAGNREAYLIWLDRDQEIDPSPEFGLMSDYVSDPADSEIQDFAKKLWSFIETLTPQEERVIRLRFESDCTLQEAGLAIGVTRERIRQIEGNAMRKLRKPNRLGQLGCAPFSIPRRHAPVVYAWELWS